MSARILKRFGFVGLLLLGATSALAELQIEITKGVDNAVRVAVVPFALASYAAAADALCFVSEVCEPDTTTSSCS